jgi:hypothetical protein
MTDFIRIREVQIMLEIHYLPHGHVECLNIPIMIVALPICPEVDNLGTASIDHDLP